MSIARIGWLCRAIAAGTILLELSFPLVLFARRLRPIIVPLTLAMQLGIGLLMGVWFTQFLFCYLFWLPWDRIRIRATADLAVLFDGGCGLCRSTANVLRRLDLLGKLQLLDITDWPVISRRFPTLDRQRAIDDMHAMTANGRIETGFDAYRLIAWRLPLLWPIAPLLYVPGVPQVGRRVYRYVAANRATSCRLDQAPRSSSTHPAAPSHTIPPAT
jgi:predicted DCC family thiol-disulfide oxidoreductase YuxK